MRSENGQPQTAQGRRSRTTPDRSYRGKPTDLRWHRRPAPGARRRTKTRRSGSKSGSGRWSHWDEIGWVHYPEIGWSHSDEIRWVHSLEILHRGVASPGNAWIAPGRVRHRRDGNPERRSPWREISLRKFERKSANRAPVVIVRRDGARGRSRTDTLLTAVDFLATSAFAAAASATFVVWSTPSP